jgi:hypothetical protein
MLTLNNVRLVDTAISLQTNHPHTFRVHTSTMNAHLVTNFPVHDPGATLFFDAHTANAALEVTLHPMFEGRFDLKTSIGYAHVELGRGPDGFWEEAGTGEQC